MELDDNESLYNRYNFQSINLISLNEDNNNYKINNYEILMKMIIKIRKKYLKKRFNRLSLESTNINSWNPSLFSGKKSNINNNNNNEIISKFYSYFNIKQGEK